MPRTGLLEGETDREIFGRLGEQAYEAWGFEGQAAAMLEEMAELTLALVRYGNEEGTAEEVYEEMVGVRSVLDSLEHWVAETLHHETVAKINRQQQSRLVKRLRQDKIPVDELLEEREA